MLGSGPSKLVLRHTVAGWETSDSDLSLTAHETGPPQVFSGRLGHSLGKSSVGVWDRMIIYITQDVGPSEYFPFPFPGKVT